MALTATDLRDRIRTLMPKLAATWRRWWRASRWPTHGSSRRWRVLTAAVAASCRFAAVAVPGMPGLLPAAQGGEMLAVSPAIAEP